MKKPGKPGSDPAFLPGARWLNAFMQEHRLDGTTISHILGVNPARVWEWLQGTRPVPPEAERNLCRWVQDGQPAGAYWIRRDKRDEQEEGT